MYGLKEKRAEASEQCCPCAKVTFPLSPLQAMVDARLCGEEQLGISLANEAILQVTKPLVDVELNATLTWVQVTVLDHTKVRKTDRPATTEPSGNARTRWDVVPDWAEWGHWQIGHEELRCPANERGRDSATGLRLLRYA